MALCLKKLKNLAKVKLIDASFLWTEPHSKRIKVKLAIQVISFGISVFSGLPELYHDTYRVTDQGSQNHVKIIM